MKKFGNASIIKFVTMKILTRIYHQPIIYAYNKVLFLVVGGGQPLNPNLGGTIYLKDARRGIGRILQPLFFRPIVLMYLIMCWKLVITRRNLRL